MSATGAIDNPHQATWHVYFSDVHVGTIGVRAADAAVEGIVRR